MRFMNRKNKNFRCLLHITIKILSLIVAFCICILICGWITENVHIESSSDNEKSTKKAVDTLSRISSAVNNGKSDALKGIAYIRKIYKIPEEATSAPKPNPANYGKSNDPAVIQAVIDSASELLDGQDMVWNADIVTYKNRGFTYYFDETILAISWVQEINDKFCTCVEIKIADGSQLRRKLSGDQYDSGVRKYCTELASETNAVVASNADFYSYRSMGITVYQRTLYRSVGNKLDTCFITADGDMLFAYAGSLNTEEEIQKYIEDNDVMFSLAFGPVLIDNGVVIHNDTYPIGQINKAYSRSAIGITDELHYMLMTINYGGLIDLCATVDEEAEIMSLLGCVKAYALDGGQTAELIFNNKVINNIDWNSERPVSDIIYFATALPEKEW